MNVWKRHAGHVAIYAGFLAGFVGGMYLGVQADAWLDAHPGPCLLGSPEECAAWETNEPSLLPFFLGIVGAVLGSAVPMLYMAAYQAYHAKEPVQ